MNDARLKRFDRANALAASACAAITLAAVYPEVETTELIRAEHDLREALQILETLKELTP